MNKTSCPIRRRPALRAFVKDFPASSVRDIQFANEHRTHQLRTKRHNHLAVCYDELGNGLALCADGVRRQLLAEEL